MFSTEHSPVSREAIYPSTKSSDSQKPISFCLSLGEMTCHVLYKAMEQEKLLAGMLLFGSERCGQRCLRQSWETPLIGWANSRLSSSCVSVLYLRSILFPFSLLLGFQAQ